MKPEDIEMRLFRRRKKEPEIQEITYDIYGGFVIEKKESGYEITWRSPNITTLSVNTEPVIDEDVQIEREGDTIRVLTSECKLKLINEGGNMKVYISKMA